MAQSPRSQVLSLSVVSKLFYQYIQADPRFTRLSDPVLTQFLHMRHVSIPSVATHETLVSLADKNATRPIVPTPSTPPSVFNVLTLGHLNFYLREKRDEAVNSNALWTFAAPPNLGRTKIEALRQFAKEEVYRNQIAGQEQELNKFDEDLAETWKHEIKLINEVPSDILGPHLADDDIEYVCPSASSSFKSRGVLVSRA